MKKKIIGILVCTLVIASFSVPMVGSVAIGPEQVSNETKYYTLNQQAHYAFSEKGSDLDNLAVTDSISLVGVEDARILYLHKYDIISGSSDLGYVKVSDNGGSSWTDLWEFQGKVDKWQQNFFELNNWIGETIKIGFHYVTGENSISQGWSVDKIVIEADGENLYEEDFEDYNEGQAWGDWVIKTGISPENLPPYDPTIDGPNRAKENEEITFLFQALDPDLDQVSYYIEWGDGDTSGWTPFFPSGSSSYSEEHTYVVEGTYTIRAKARDVNDAESDWSEHQIKITTPRSRQINNLFIFRNLENLLEILLNHFQFLKI